MVVVRYGNDFIVGFQHRQEAERFLVELGDRFGRFGLRLHPEKTRLIEFGQFAEAYFNRENAHRKIGQLDQAISDYTKAIEFKPNYAEAYYNRGNAYAKKDLWDQAITEYSKAIEINENYVEAYTNRGSIYSMKHQFDQALLNFERAIEIDPQYAIAHFNKALVCEMVGRPWDAVKAHKDFIEYAGPHQVLQIEIAREKIKQLTSGPHDSTVKPFKVWQ